MRDDCGRISTRFGDLKEHVIDLVVVPKIARVESDAGQILLLHQEGRNTEQAIGFVLLFTTSA